MMNTSSMNTALKLFSYKILYPNGNKPPNKHTAHVLRYHGCGLTNLEIGLGGHGCLITCFLYPMRLPRKTKGIEIPNHKATKAEMVPM